MSRKRIDYTGQKFGRLTAIEFSHYNKKNKSTQWLFKCRCGNEHIANVSSVKRGFTKSCGCIRKDSPNNSSGVKRYTKRGYRHSKTFYSWRNMQNKCYDEDYSTYKNYGGMGVMVCEHWLGEQGFVNFLDDVGERPDGMFLDLIDKNGDFEPSNYNWITIEELRRNSKKNKKVSKD